MSRQLILDLRCELAEIPELTVEFPFRLFARFEPYPWVWRDTMHLISRWLKKVENALENIQLHESELEQFMPLLLRRLYIFKSNGERERYYRYGYGYPTSHEILSSTLKKHLLLQAGREKDFVLFKLLSENFYKHLEPRQESQILFFLLANHNIEFYDYYCEKNKISLHSVYRSACVAYVSKNENDIQAFQKECQDRIRNIRDSSSRQHTHADGLCGLKSSIAIIGNGWLEQHLQDTPELSTQITCINTAEKILTERHDNTRASYSDKQSALSAATKYSNNPFKNALFQAANVLSDTDYCLNLLRPLNDKLAQILAHRNINLDLFRLDQTASVIICGYYAWPVENSASLPRLYSVLDELLLEHEQTYGFNVTSKTNEAQKKVLYFNVGIPTFVADNFILKNLLYKDVRNNNLAHGDNSHRLQIFILNAAINDGEIHLPPGKTFNDFVRSLITESKTDDTELWRLLLDQPHCRKFGDFSSPTSLHSFLLCHPNPNTTTLSAYLRVKFSKSMQQLCTRSELPYPALLASLGCGTNSSHPGVQNKLKLRADDTPFKSHYQPIHGISVFAKLKKEHPTTSTQTVSARLLSMLGDF